MYDAKTQGLFPTISDLITIEKAMGTFVSDQDIGLERKQFEYQVPEWKPLISLTLQGQDRIQKCIDLARHQFTNYIDPSLSTRARHG